MFRVTPSLRNGNGASWYDADWFEPALTPERSDDKSAALQSTRPPGYALAVTGAWFVGYLPTGGRGDCA